MLSRDVFVACIHDLVKKNLNPKCRDRTMWYIIWIYLFHDNLATGGSLTDAILSCHVELSKYSTSKLHKNMNHTQNEYTALLESITTFKKFVNSVKNSYWNSSRRIRRTM